MAEPMSWKDIDARLTAFMVHPVFNKLKRPVKIWGVPRGGQIVEGMLVNMYSNPASVIHAGSPPDADIFVDDVVDSGHTADVMQKAYGKDTWAIVDKRTERDKSLGWVSFPWEGAPDTDHESIVIRQLEAIGEDPNREGLLETPGRVVKAWKELFSGYSDCPAVKWFTDDADEMIVVRNIRFWSMCEHHMLPFHGTADVAYIPNGRVIGVSKIPRLVNHYARRLQIQERLAKQVGDALSDTTPNDSQVRGVAVHMVATHLCMAARGVRAEGTELETNYLTGAFRTTPSARAEFFARIR